MVKIAKDIPVPVGRRRPSKLEKDLGKMKIGDSFLFSCRSRSRLDKIFKNLGFKITVRRANKAQIRVWRIK